jgi:glycosyltransferase involved in cell wall biosynthesis
LKKRPLRVLHVNTERTWRGGEQQTFYLIEGLAARGVPQLLVAQKKGVAAERARERGLPVKPLRMRGEVDPFAILELARLMRDGRFSIVHCHTSHAHVLASLASALLGPLGPIVVVSRRVDFSIYRRSFLGLNGLKYHYGVDRYVCVSHAIRRVLIADGLRPERIGVVHSGIDLARIDSAPVRTDEIRREWSVPAGHALVANVAHMADHKGQVYLVEAVPQVLARRNDVTFAIVGDGELRASLEQRARELGVADRIRFPGFREDVPTILKALDVFVMPSHMEGLGTSVLDAMAAGAPVVGTEAGGMTEMLEHGVNGLVAPIRDAATLAKHVLRLLDDRAEAQRFAARARQDVVDRFSKEAMVAGTVREYEALLA